MLFMICRTPLEPCPRSKLDEFKADDDCCGFIDVTLLLLLSKIVGIAVAGWPKPLPPPANKFNSLAADVEPLFDERRFRNDNDFKRLNFVDSLALFDAAGDCWWRSSNVDTNWSKTFKSAFILEFRMSRAVVALLPSGLLVDGRCRRWEIYRMLMGEKKGKLNEMENENSGEK